MEKTVHLTKKYNLNIEGNSDAAQTIVFAHGFGSDQTTWRFVKEHFKERYRLVLFDNIGSGASDTDYFSPLRYSSLHAYASDLLEITNHLAITNGILIAHSVSSMIGMLAGIKQPEIFSKMVFIGASPRYLNDGDYKGGFEQADLDALYQSMTSNYYSWVSGFAMLTMGNPDKPELAEEFAATLSKLRPDIALSVVKTIFQSDLRQELSRLNTQVLLIQANNDFAVPDSVAEFLNLRVRNSRLVRTNTEGHFPQMSAPAAVIKALKTFL